MTSAVGFDLLTQRPKRIKPGNEIRIIKKDSPLIVSIPHAGTWIPPEIVSYFHQRRFLLIDTDLYTEKLYRPTQTFASVIQTAINPYVVNANRQKTNKSKPILPTSFLNGRPVLRRPLPSQVGKLLIKKYYDPYRDGLEALVLAAKRKFGFALLIDVHSMNSVGGAKSIDPGEIRPDFTVSDVYGKSVPRAITRIIETELRSRGYSVERNKPYAGGAITQHFGMPKKSLFAIQIEIRRGLFMNEVATELAINQPAAFKANQLAITKLSLLLSKNLKKALKQAKKSVSL